MTEDVQSWVEIAQICGAGGLIVGGILWFYWNKDRAERITHLQDQLSVEREYIRTSDKETLVVLHELTQTIGNVEAGDVSRYSELCSRIDQLTELIRGHYVGSKEQ